MSACSAHPSPDRTIAHARATARWAKADTEPRSTTFTRSHDHPCSAIARSPDRRSPMRAARRGSSSQSSPDRTIAPALPWLDRPIGDRRYRYRGNGRSGHRAMAVHRAIARWAKAALSLSARPSPDRTITHALPSPDHSIGDHRCAPRRREGSSQPSPDRTIAPALPWLDRPIGDRP